MRTKSTSSNGGHNTPGSERAPPTPTTMSQDESEKLRTWLAKSKKPFYVATGPLNRKRKRDAPPPQHETNLFEERLHVQYEVRPKNKWESLRKFRKFTISSESIGIGECILVKHDEREDGMVHLDIEDQWKAIVLEIKALDPEHVFVRVAWLNRPEDLDSGRKPHHGRHELIPTNQMDVIDAMAVNGSFAVTHWDDTDESSFSMSEEQYFWRQTYDCLTKTYSKLHTICVDATPQNPDELILQCSNEECRIWLHLKCIAEYAVEAAAADYEGSEDDGALDKKKAGKAKATAGDTKAQAEASKGGFSAAVYLAGLPSASDDEAADEKSRGPTTSHITITDPNGTVKKEAVRCLKCKTAISDN